MDIRKSGNIYTVTILTQDTFSIIQNIVDYIFKIKTNFRKSSIQKGLN